MHNFKKHDGPSSLGACSRNTKDATPHFQAIPRRYIQLLHRLLVKADSAQLIGQHQSLVHATHEVELLRLLARSIVPVALFQARHVRAKQCGALGKVIQRKAALLGRLGRALSIAAVLHVKCSVVVNWLWCELGERGQDLSATGTRCAGCLENSIEKMDASSFCQGSGFLNLSKRPFKPFILAQAASEYQ